MSKFEFIIKWKINKYRNGNDEKLFNKIFCENKIY